MATAVGVAVGRDGLVGGTSVGGGGGVAVKTAGVGAWEEQEERRIKRKRKEEGMRVVRGRGMEGILTELSENKVSRINEKVSCKVPVIYKHALNSAKIK